MKHGQCIKALILSQHKRPAGVWIPASLVMDGQFASATFSVGIDNCLIAQRARLCKQASPMWLQPSIARRKVKPKRSAKQKLKATAMRKRKLKPLSAMAGRGR